MSCPISVYFSTRYTCDLHCEWKHHCVESCRVGTSSLNINTEHILHQVTLFNYMRSVWHSQHENYEVKIKNNHQITAFVNSPCSGILVTVVNTYTVELTWLGYLLYYFPRHQVKYGFLKLTHYILQCRVAWVVFRLIRVCI